MTKVALVVLDTLRYDYFSRHFDWIDGIWFQNAYSTSHWTIPAHASMLTGRYPSEVGVHGKAPSLDCENEVITEKISSNGYTTHCYTANPQIYQFNGWDRGYNEYIGYQSLGLIHHNIFDWEKFNNKCRYSGMKKYTLGLLRCLTEDCATLKSLKRGVEMARRTKADGGATMVHERIKKTSFTGDEFVFINLMEAHVPYYPPEDTNEPIRVTSTDALLDRINNPELVKNAYQESVKILSEKYKRIYTELNKEFDYIITLSDHGETLGEKGMWNHSLGLYRQLTHIPLVISGKGIKDDRRDEVVSILDVHKTLAELMDISVKSRGRNLMNSVESKDWLVEYHGILPFHKTQFEKNDIPAEKYAEWDQELRGYVSAENGYCYETPQGNLVSSDDTEVQHERLNELKESIDAREVEPEDPSFSIDVRDRLEDLGYA